MVKPLPAAFCAAVVLPLLAGCQSRLHDENLALYEENRQLRDQLEAGPSQVSTGIDAADYDALQRELAESQQLINALQNDLDAKFAQPSNLPDIAGVDTAFDDRTGEVTMSVAGDVLFGSGRSDLKDSAKQTLAQVAAALQETDGDVRVVGHTDTDPVTKTKGTYTDNFGLSSARALTVMRYLQLQGVPADRMQAVARGEFDPRGEDKSQNRRVEIVVETR